MRRNGFAAVAVAAAISASFSSPTDVAFAAKKKAGPKVVGTDPAGDWGAAMDPNISPLGDALGQDLIEAAIAMDGTDTIIFVIKVTSLPPWGGWPEITRYTWDFNVDGEFTELDGKFTNYTRGACDPTSGQCPPPRNPGLQPFFVRGNCQFIDAVMVCEELGVVQANFDAGKGTITIPVPLDLIQAKPGSKIKRGDNIYGGSISATPSAFFSTDGLPLDTLDVTRTFVVKGGKKK